MKSQIERRNQLVEQARAHLDATGHPQRMMWGILAVAGVAGFLASVALLHLGVGHMSIRYPLAVTAAYATFYGLLWLWIRREASATHRHSDDPEGLFASVLAGVGLASLGKVVAEVVPSGPPAEKEKSDGVSPLDAWDGSGLDAVGEGCGLIVVLVLIAALCTLLVSLYLVAISPLLLAEILVDGVLLGALARMVPPQSTPHWSRAVVRRTGLAALLTVVLFGLVGLGFEHAAPGARTLGEAWSATHPPAKPIRRGR